MRRIARSSRRLALLIALGAMMCTTLVSVDGRSGRRGVLPPRTGFGAAIWAAALPKVLTAPALDAGWQLVSMVVHDVDADGDADVVANDGSLNLVVWINDGTGRLHRHDNGKPSATGGELSGPAVSDQPARSQVAAHVPAPFVGNVLTGSALSDDSHLALSRTTDPARSRLVGDRSPRGPPSFPPVS